MNVSLTPRLEKLVHEKLATGLYDSADDVVREALRLLGERDLALRRRAGQLRTEISRGLEQVERRQITVFSAREIKAEGRKRLARQRRMGIHRPGQPGGRGSFR